MAETFISRAEARAKGFKRYFTGKTCCNGHIAERYVSSLACTECSNDKCKQWGRDNPDKKLELYRDWIDRNPTYQADWAKANPEARRAAARKWYVANADRDRARASKWQKDNPERSRANVRNRQAKKRASGGKHTADEILEMLRKQNWKCAACGVSIKRKRHIDHIMPVVLGGTNDISNLQGLCPLCNHRKGGKDPLVWAKENGRLL